MLRNAKRTPLLVIMSSFPHGRLILPTGEVHTAADGGRERSHHGGMIYGCASLRLVCPGNQIRIYGKAGWQYQTMQISKNVLRVPSSCVDTTGVR